jgi:hypothetical protein
VIRRWLVKGDFEAVLQIKGLRIKVVQNKGLTDGFWGVCIIPGANSLLSVGYVTVLLTGRAVSSPVPKSEGRGTPQVSIQGGFKHDFIVRVGRDKTGKAGTEILRFE